MTGFRDAEFYVQIEPDWYRYAGEPVLKGAKAVAITQKRPSRPRGGAVTVKLTVRVPDGAFLPLRPEAVVVIPTDMALITPLEVIAGDANDE